jgi:hypothetical protein
MVEKGNSMGQETELEYEVFLVPGTSQLPTTDRNVEDAREEIKRAYLQAAEWGGRVIAGHTLECRSAEVAQIPTNYLFLVIERPVD